MHNNPINLKKKRVSVSQRPHRLAKGAKFGAESEVEPTSYRKPVSQDRKSIKSKQNAD